MKYKKHCLMRKSTSVENINKIFRSLLLFSCVLFFACESENTSVNGKSKLNSIAGLIEKGPFVAGSSVTVYELDNDLNGTGRVFEAKTDSEGAFSIKTSTSLVSRYVKLSVNGFYFNEFTGDLSIAPITLESLADISQTGDAKINANILTHLEAPRVLKLVSDGLSFNNAKQQAQKELLGAFLITDKTVIPEKVSITDNNTSANILIAISSILLNQRSDAQFSEFMSEIRSDLVDGTISEGTKAKIAQSSLGLSYSRIKQHIINRYAELGKTVKIGAFELFIDGNGNGKIGEPYEEDQIISIIVDSFFQSEANAQAAFNASMASMYSFVQDLYLFDAVYTNSVALENLLPSNPLWTIYNHTLNADTKTINDLWRTSWKSITYFNEIIYALNVQQEWAAKYITYARTYRACLYLNMIGWWGDLPLATIPVFVMDDWYLSRISQNEILNFIISELEHTYSALPEEATQAGCTKYFAKAMLARAYLYKKDFSNVLNAVAAIINSGKYTLNENTVTIYAGGSAESIFEMPNHDQYSSVSYRNFIQKGNYMPVCRYAEVLLMAAEANYKTGNTAQSLFYLNQIRTRQGVANISAVTEDVLLNAWQEELQNEGLWFLTLKRFGKAMQTLHIPEYQLLLPIPRWEILVNPKMTQNPGW